MFIEPNHLPDGSGWIEVICGSMFSGKTEELIRRLRRAEIARLSVGVYRPVVDVRYGAGQVVSHVRSSLPALPITRAADLLTLTDPPKVIGIDEAQFLDDAIVDVANTLANRGHRVLIAGLDMDYTGKPFGPMPQLMAVAEFVTKLHAICVRTGGMAHYSHRLSDQDRQQFLLGASEAYEPLSRKAFVEAAQLPFDGQ